MNATSKSGVWSQEITENLSVVVDTNRNQIIKKKNGKPTIFSFPSEPTIGMVDCMIKIITISEEIDTPYQAALAKYKERRSSNN